MTEDFFESFLEASTFEYIVYIGVDDGFAHRVDVNSAIDSLTLDVQGQSLTITQDSKSTTTYFAFNDPVEIPDVTQ